MKTLKMKTSIICVALAAIFLVEQSCSSLNKSQKGAAIGAGGGGIIGALIGRAAGNTALGAIIGGAVGGTAGAVIGHHMDKQAEEIKQTVPGADVTRQGEGIIVKFDSGILFDVGKTDVKSVAITNLQNLATSLKNNPQTNILIVGHTDNTGSATLNDDLSIRRASAVKAYLVGDGVDGSRLSIEGKGSSEPIADNTTAAGRAKNRRVELAISANDQMKTQAAQTGN